MMTLYGQPWVLGQKIKGRKTLVRFNINGILRKTLMTNGVCDGNFLTLSCLIFLTCYMIVQLLSTSKSCHIEEISWLI